MPRQRLAPAHFQRVTILSEPYSPEDAVAAGFLDRVVAPEALREEALKHAGASMRDVVRTVVYVTDMKDAAEVARAHGERFREILPVSTLVQVSALLEPQLKVEIEAYALLSD